MFSHQYHSFIGTEGVFSQSPIVLIGLCRCVDWPRWFAIWCCFAFALHFFHSTCCGYVYQVASATSFGLLVKSVFQSESGTSFRKREEKNSKSKCIKFRKQNLEIRFFGWWLWFVYFLPWDSFPVFCWSLQTWILVGDAPSPALRMCSSHLKLGGITNNGFYFHIRVTDFLEHVFNEDGALNHQQNRETIALSSATKKHDAWNVKGWKSSPSGQPGPYWVEPVSGWDWEITIGSTWRRKLPICWKITEKSANVAPGVIFHFYNFTTQPLSQNIWTLPSTIGWWVGRLVCKWTYENKNKLKMCNYPRTPTMFMCNIYCNL